MRTTIGSSHIFDGGYAAGYYSYKWAEVLSADAYSAFEDTAGWTIVALDHRGQELRRIMNGPGHLERSPVGMEDGSQWDVTVRGTVFFALPKDVQHVAVRVAVPQAQPVEIQSEVR